MSRTQLANHPYCSASGIDVARKAWPTAMQAAVEGQDTPLRVAVAAPVGLGVVCIDQLDPFQLSASVPSPMEPMMELPTASHKVFEGHDAPLRLLRVAPAGLGEVWSDQLIPFQLSASVTWVPELCP